MRHSWQFLGGEYRTQRHRCTRCGLERKKLVPLEGFPVATYKLKSGAEVRGVAPKCQAQNDKTPHGVGLDGQPERA